MADASLGFRAKVFLVFSGRSFFNNFDNKLFVSVVNLHYAYLHFIFRLHMHAPGRHQDAIGPTRVCFPGQQDQFYRHLLSTKLRISYFLHYLLPPFQEVSHNFKIQHAKDNLVLVYVN